VRLGPESTVCVLPHRPSLPVPWDHWGRSILREPEPAAWVLGHDPAKQILSVTYAQDFSDTLARKSRTLMTSAFYEALFDTRLSKGREAVSDFETTDGGTRFSTSVGGVLTGRGADIIIIDDPLKADDALSEARRRSVNEWFDNTLRSRLNSQDKGAIIIVMQRLHADDLVAHVQEHESWDVLSFLPSRNRMRPITCGHPTAAGESIERPAKSCNPLCYRRPL
jgi:hypothetical protein